MEKKIIRVGMVGTGMIFDRHCRGIKASPDAEVTAICDVNKDALARKAKLVGVPMEATVTDYTKMMDEAISVQPLSEECSKEEKKRCFLKPSGDGFSICSSNTAPPF